jgi:hypothetical protein
LALGEPQKQNLHTGRSTDKNSRFEAIRGQFDAIGDRFEGKFLGSNAVTPLES